MGFDACGILPKPSNLWDLVPFSFIANWITGVGANIRRLEYIAVLATIPAYYVHSYTIASPFTLDELQGWNLGSESVAPLTFKIYYRDVSLYVPLMRDTEFGFALPSSVPPLAVIGSLLYQLLFA
jgi:hypothetical protein